MNAQAGLALDLEPPWPRLTVAEAVERWAGIRLAGDAARGDAEALAAHDSPLSAAASAGLMAPSPFLSSCLKLAVPARTPTGRLRNTKHSTMISPVPVSSNGGTLKARM